MFAELFLAVWLLVLVGMAVYAAISFAAYCFTSIAQAAQMIASSLKHVLYR